MNKLKVYGFGIGIVVVALLVLLSQSLFIVSKTEQALVLQFGEVQKVVREPGLNVRTPFLQNVVYYDKRILSLSPPPFEVLLADKKRIIMDSYARYKIDDPVTYYERVRGEERLNDLLGRSMNAGLRRVIATVSLPELLSSERNTIMGQILDGVTGQAETLGISVVDVRFSRTDLPPQTSQAVYNRMRAEREREAQEARAQGNEIAQTIRSGAEKKRTVLLSQARGEATRIRGDAQAMQNNILSEAYSQNTEFYKFYQALEKYKTALADGNTSLVFSTDGEFFRYFNINPSEIPPIPSR